jgi:predicted dehydrogenase
MARNGATETLERAAPLCVGLIGVTGYAYAYFEELTKLVEKGLVVWGAVTIINPEQAAEQVAFFKSIDVPIYDDYREMLEKEDGKLNWVCIPTAISWHTEMTLDSLRRGLPVLLEKPVTSTLQEVKAIQDAEKESGKAVAIGFQYYYCPTTAEIKKRLLSGVIGKIERIDCLCLWPRDTDYYHRNDWAGCVHDGHGWVLDSPLHNALSHLINLILFFAGPSLEERADLLDVAAELYRAKDIQNYDTIRCETKLSTGPHASVLLSHSSVKCIDPEIRIEGSKGTFIWRYFGTHTIETEDGTEYLESDSPLEVRACMFDKIVRLLHGDTSVHVCTTELAKGEVKWVNAVQDAAVVHDVPNEYRRQLTGENGEIFETIDQLDDYAVSAYNDRCSFKALGVPWAVEPTYIELSDYRGFEARHFTSEESASMLKKT